MIEASGGHILYCGYVLLGLEVLELRGDFEDGKLITEHWHSRTSEQWNLSDCIARSVDSIDESRSMATGVAGDERVFVISNLQKEMDWREACILSDMLLKSYISATQHNALELHPVVDLEKGEGFSTSELAIQRLKYFQSHRNSTGWDDTLLAVVIPGYSLHLFEPRVPSPTHWVHHTDNTDRVTQVFRCRLRPDFLVAGKEIGLAIQQIEKSPLWSPVASLAASQVKFD